MDISAVRPIHQGNPDGVNCYTRYPVAGGVWAYFAQDVVRAVDVRVQPAPVARAEQSALDALAGIDRVLADRLQVQEAALGGVAFFAHEDLDAHQFRLVAQQLDEA